LATTSDLVPRRSGCAEVDTQCARTLVLNYDWWERGAGQEDRNYLQGIAADQIGFSGSGSILNLTHHRFSRGISLVGKDFIVSHYRTYEGTTPLPISYQGINDAFIEKGFRCSLLPQWGTG
jgi:hypothetical protein